MNAAEARTILEAHLSKFREQSYAQLASLVGKDSFRAEISKDDVAYQVEIEVVWDAHAGGPVRVLGSIDDGGWRAFVPVTADFIKAPDGSLV